MDGVTQLFIILLVAGLMFVGAEVFVPGGILGLFGGIALGVVWEIVPGLEETEVPTLLLQPLVENAIKHGISPDPEGGILRVSVQRDQERLVLAVANTGKPLPEIRTEGTGLGNLRQRLALLPVLAPVLELDQVGGWTRAKLTLAWRWTA